jgi:hypothetical protein
MKNYPLKKTTFILFLLALAGFANAQATTKPQAFQNYPTEIGCNSAILDALFTQTENTPVNLTFANNFTITGTLTGIDKSTTVKTLIIKVSNFSNMLFSISRVSDIHTPEKYVGRLMNAQAYADYYELVLDNGQYKLKKQLTDNVLTPCKPKQ